MEPDKKVQNSFFKKNKISFTEYTYLAGGVCLGISSIKFAIDGNFSLAVTLILLCSNTRCFRWKSS